MFFLAKQFLRRRFKKKTNSKLFPLKIISYSYKDFLWFCRSKIYEELETDSEINSQPSDKNVIRIFSLGEPKSQQFILFAEMLILIPVQ